MANSRVRISTHIPDDQPQASFVGRGETVWELTQQCPDCGERRVATNGIVKWCNVCGWWNVMNIKERFTEWLWKVLVLFLALLKRIW